MAKMGLAMRDDPPKVLDLSVREWGAPAGGFALSIREVPREDPDASPAVSVVLRNLSDDRRQLTIPGWLVFYKWEVAAADGTRVPVSPFGRERLKPERQTERFEISLAAGEANETQIPLGSIFSIRARGRYRVKASCEPLGEIVVRSNEILI
jgi:hypothetical protein